MGQPIGRAPFKRTAATRNHHGPRGLAETGAEVRQTPPDSVACRSVRPPCAGVFAPSAMVIRTL